MTRLSAIVCAVCAFLCAQARTATDFFTTAPDAVIRLIPQATRLDMVDYFNYGSQRASDNFFGGPARIASISDNTLSFNADDNVSVQLAVIPARTDTVIAIVTTLALPVKDSAVKFYTKDWQPLKKSVFEMPPYTGWVTSEGLSNETDLRLNLPFMPVEAVFSDDASSLTLYNRAADYLGDRQELPFSRWVIPEKVYSVVSGQFIPAK